jgi:hypothetical protein
LFNCNPVPHGTRNHLHEALLNGGLTSADSGPVESGDRAKRCLSEDSAPAAYSRAEDRLKLSDDVIEESFTSTATICRGIFHALSSPLGFRPIRIADSSSTDRVSFSSARTTKRFPSS